ncbi:hypothetical protein MKW98_008506 [Papaver atlanticum]|uniref:Malectin-like domain-containing protein n=1 Tax=Papaver atlanticum TaxID=357466 RepID=A0AAD4TE56_9MAGN|nr:hypothetical protein MKW98_008506 [Papaver atlanticum]
MRSLNSNLLIFVLLSHLSCFHILIVPVSAKVFISIDCGSSSLESYTDGNSIEWVGDDQYIQTGEPRNIVTMFSRPWDTVREFPTRKKNCYSIDVNNDKAEDITTVERVLVRASFYYANYDNKSNPPTFNLQFNGNNWTQIVTTMENLATEEVVYSLNHGNTITVCLAQTHRDNIPFISSLEVRSLESDMYSYVDSNYPLFFMSRKAYGTNTIIRFPEDSYDRFWESFGPLRDSSALRRVRNSSPSIKVDVADRIPETLFTTAITLKNSSGGGDYMWSSAKATDRKVPMHFNAYFSEVLRLSSTQKRSFNVSINTFNFNESGFNSYNFGIVNPPYGRALQVRLNNISAESFNSYEVFMRSTNDSTLPPLINALEGYTIGDKLVKGTNSDDVNSLGLLQKSFIQLQDWQGDPCLPSPYTWDWVACDFDPDSPRITALYLNDIGLVGTLPDFNGMDALEIIDLGSNNLTGNIPEFLGTFPKLKVLNLADNNFAGAIPSSLLNNNNLRLRVSGNPNLSTNNTSTNRNSTEPKIPSTSSSKTSITSTIPIIILGSVIIQMFDSIFGLLL